MIFNGFHKNNLLLEQIRSLNITWMSLDSWMLYRVVLCCPRLFYNWFQKSTWDTKFFSSDIRTMEKALYKGEYVSALFMDLPRSLWYNKWWSFDCKTEGLWLFWRSSQINEKPFKELTINLVQKEILSQGYHMAHIDGRLIFYRAMHLK